ncbi:unnamed protein product [Aphanomyces euteiches]|uniref:Uncharacterized protein n=1 Tax=Aphanomyces euteiches TaxID=100861 RepID=A0A6G0X084_9STRA|nr:hypothetical protein Ae201684_009839 [Aphanomyces euteiches]KAH9095982.1 hypothetical protein Ae201684P_010188 [Aphanomyces euteiches]KAH9125513.1 hypothetical protein LEN26_009554 [Aphanomyces euteiches]KAH9126830.1 hypothetical protein AeMF1_002758 [Aphanomyces euteiches]KAH9143931.1 hypothetical protein AeRB84_012091 [Aphanomyces euteiches]
MSTAEQVLVSQELIEIISSFQGGVYQDMQRFRSKMCPIYNGFYDPSFICPQMKHTESILGPWFEKYGMPRVSKLLRYSLAMRRVLVQYAVYFGNVDLAAYLHREVNLLSYPEPLLDMAALNNQATMLEFLHQIGHRGKTTMGLIWAVHRGHVQSVQFLVGVDDTIEETARANAVKIAHKAGYKSVVKILLSTKCQRRPQALHC